MRIGIAQVKAFTGDIEKNILKHKRIIEKAAANDADLIFFPELSLTGYEPRLADELATGYDDMRFDDFQNLSDRLNITIGAGAPVKINSGVFIGMLIFQPGKPRQIYTKQILHEDELPFFSNGKDQVILTVQGKRVAPAICYESLKPGHSEKVFRSGAEIYLASVAKAADSLDRAYDHYARISKQYGMTVMMANSTGICDHFESAGGSAAWNNKGQLVHHMKEDVEGILIYDTQTEEIHEWTERNPKVDPDHEKD